MTNGAVGQTVSSMDGPVLTVKYRDGEKKIIVGPRVPGQRLEIADRSELKSGAAVALEGGPITAEMFLAYVEQCLVPTLKCGGIDRNLL